jgi:ribosome-associated protein YbcJ (S4-like RNA binding protein)
MGWCDNGAEANQVIEEGMVKVNNVTELRKRNKIVPGMIVSLEEDAVLIE